jgi:hypothetical protein
MAGSAVEVLQQRATRRAGHAHHVRDPDAYRRDRSRVAAGGLFRDALPREDIAECVDDIAVALAARPGDKRP